MNYQWMFMMDLRRGKKRTVKDCMLEVRPNAETKYGLVLPVPQIETIG